MTGQELRERVGYIDRVFNFSFILSDERYGEFTKVVSDLYFLGGISRDLAYFLVSKYGRNSKRPLDLTVDINYTIRSSIKRVKLGHIHNKNFKIFKSKKAILEAFAIRKTKDFSSTHQAVINLTESWLAHILYNIKVVARASYMLGIIDLDEFTHIDDNILDAKDEESRELLMKLLIQKIKNA